jgi:Asp-tRNA(Asn)/Glu-tRNA(Gln) amidotransferase A subunit family amidase
MNSGEQMNPAEAVRETYRRIREQGEKPVWIHLIPEEVSLARAEALGAPDGSLPLYGMTFAIKDNIDLAGVPTTAGCPAYRYVPSKSATVVEKLMAAGALPIGKTNLDQFATVRGVFQRLRCALYLRRFEFRFGRGRGQWSGGFFFGNGYGRLGTRPCIL